MRRRRLRHLAPGVLLPGADLQRQAPLCLAVYGGSGVGAGARLVQWNCHTQTTAYPNQWWRFTTFGSTVILMNGKTNLCLGIEGGGATQRGKAVQKPCTNALDVSWHREWLGSDLISGPSMIGNSSSASTRSSGSRRADSAGHEVGLSGPSDAIEYGLDGTRIALPSSDTWGRR
ncbi:hypothetical protein GCM10022403_079280 [Streptomyces coacervatus]|uniref:Ricin B lectin domain-containing protein n=2 Tax=Streptomyces coacervatus TaxID=647381 RepID=A0ABP7J4J8_9ACTN